MPGFTIGAKRVGEDAPVYVVAELSANHGQSLDKALQTIEAAAKAGADAIKLQTYTPDTLTLKSDAPPFVVKTKNEWAGRTLHDLYAEAMMPWEWHKPLMDAAASHGLACFSTPFDTTAAYFLHGLDVPAYKIASFEVVDLPLVETVARLGRPMILSSGMASLAEIEAAVKTCREAGNEQIAVLRCVSAYPARPEAMDIRSLEILGGLGVVLGLSDHTQDNVAALTAVSLGARLIEKHFIVDRSWGGPDAFFSLEPEDFKRLVTEVRACEAALGRPRFGPSPDEVASTAFRRSLFVARDLKAGDLITCDHARSVRPSYGLEPKFLPDVLGRVATRDLRSAQPFTWDMAGASPETQVTLRAASSDDAAVLLRWRNDELTRRNSHSTAEVQLDEHQAWLGRILDSKETRLFVGESNGAAIGQIRFDLKPHRTAEISITVAPEARGRGLASDLLRAAEAIALQEGVRALLAEIKPANEASVRAFKRAGYYGFALTGEGDARLWRCERRVRGAK